LVIASHLCLPIHPTMALTDTGLYLRVGRCCSAPCHSVPPSLTASPLSLGSILLVLHVGLHPPPTPPYPSPLAHPSLSKKKKHTRHTLHCLPLPPWLPPELAQFFLSSTPVTKRLPAWTPVSGDALHTPTSVVFEREMTSATHGRGSLPLLFHYVGRGKAKGQGESSVISTRSSTAALMAADGARGAARVTGGAGGGVKRPDRHGGGGRAFLLRTAYETPSCAEAWRRHLIHSHS